MQRQVWPPGIHYRPPESCYYQSVAYVTYEWAYVPHEARSERMRGSDLGPSGPPPSEGRTNRGDSRLKRIVLLVGVLGAFVMLAVGAIFAGAASAATQISYVCANKSSGQLF